MLAVMNASGPGGVPEPTGDVEKYLLRYEDELSAGVGSKAGDLPTEGWWLWKETDKSAIKKWVFRNRDNLWGTLYGAARVPSGKPEL